MVTGTYIKIALQCGAAKFWPDTQSTRDDAYLVGQSFLEKFYTAARAVLAAVRNKDQP